VGSDHHDVSWKGRGPSQQNAGNPKALDHNQENTN